MEAVVLVASHGDSGMVAALAQRASPVLSTAEVLRLVELENAARTSEEIVMLLQIAEKGSAEASTNELYRAHLFSWMEVIARLQLELVAAALRHRKAGGCIDDTFACSPAELAAAIRTYAAQAAALDGTYDAPWDPRKYRNAPMTAARTDGTAGVLATAADDEWAELKELRTAVRRAPKQVRQIALYVKYNRCRRGSLREGDPAPDAELHLLQLVGNGSNSSIGSSAEDEGDAAANGSTTTSSSSTGTGNGGVSSRVTSLHKYVRAGAARGMPTLVIAGSYS